METAISASAEIPERFCRVRALTEALSAPLSAEDQTAQSMADVSPTKWHRAHTTWFFEEFLLRARGTDYVEFDPYYRYLFNSYYEAVGDRHPRPERGVITRPGIDEIAKYRRHVDHAMLELMSTVDVSAVLPLIELGLHHEQQHQELLLMDIKHVLSRNVLDPAYGERGAVDVAQAAPAPAAHWCGFPGGLVEVGHDSNGFAFDNEGPRHRHYVEEFSLASRLVTCGEVADFIADGGYQRHELWLSDGWALAQAQRWDAPLYWRREGPHEWSVFTLSGRAALQRDEPVCHVSYFEADAIARWAGARLPTEFEWETAATAMLQTQATQHAGHLLDVNSLHPRPAPPAAAPHGPSQLFGDVWEWTSSAYLPYPGFRPAVGAVGEYNGKFMVNQHVLRGGSCLTPPGHVRASYRNFFPPAARWPMTGLRLARDGADAA